jgi:ABC-type cobalamin/Fe3+-siderophores transport system ATPase subunit
VTQTKKSNLIGIVGPCSAGKSTLIQALRAKGYPARHIAQEHSYVPDMWQRMDNPRLLIYLDVSYVESMRRKPLDMSQEEFDAQVRRLSHACQHADFYLHTDELTAHEVLGRVEGFLAQALTSS